MVYNPIPWKKNYHENIGVRGNHALKRINLLLIFTALALIIGSPSQGLGGWVFSDGFETPWTGDYYAPWTIEGYRWGSEPVAIMQQTIIAHSGSYGLKLEMKSVASNGQFWGAINANVPASAMLKQYDPYMSVWYYDQGFPSASNSQTGQLYACPSPVTGPNDWTDVQFGGRRNVYDNYYFITAPAPSGWHYTGVARSEGWHNLKFQLSSTDGYIRFYLDGSLVGKSDRNDYTDLGLATLSTMFLPPLSNYGDNKPYAIFDDYQVGSNVPLPATVWLLGSGLVGLGLLRGRNFFKG